MRRPFVVLVEDDPTLAETIGVAHVDIRDGLTAVRIIESLKPTVVLLDLPFVGHDGYEIIRQLRSQPETRDIRIVVITADKTVRYRTPVRVDAILIKPFHIDALHATIEHVMGAPAVMVRLESSSVLAIGSERSGYERLK
jgi:CheY-like chemotaxis protein